MPQPDASSFPAYLASLNLRPDQVTTRPGQIIPGPPAFVVEIALRLMGGRVFATPSTRSLLRNLGIGDDDIDRVIVRLRSRAVWAQMWSDLAAPHEAAADAAQASGDRETALTEYRAALALRRMSTGGDGYYFCTPPAERLAAAPRARALYARLRALSGERVESVMIPHADRTIHGRLHFPPDTGCLRDARYLLRAPAPALLGLHPLFGDKDGYDQALAPMREAGYVTLCIDLPAHGDSATGPRLRANDQELCAAALDWLAARPEVNPDRVGVMGGSLGAFYALRTAAVRSHPEPVEGARAKVCVGIASAFDIAGWLPQSSPGLQDDFAHVIGAPSRQAAYALARDFRNHDFAPRVHCPVFLGHGTQDHVAQFATTYEIASRLPTPPTVQPFVGVDHEIAASTPPAVAEPLVAWLKRNL